MRRLFALMLIATSGWLIYQAATTHLGGVSNLFSSQMMVRLEDLHFSVPAAGGLLGLLGGLLVFFGGPGGAALSLIGGLAVSGFGMALNETFDLDHFWQNEMAVGVILLMLAGITATTSRASAYDG